MSLHVDHPLLLLLALLAIPIAIIGWRALPALDTTRRVLAIGLRVTIIMALAAMLSGVSARREHDAVTVIGLLDVSGSVRRFAHLPALDELSASNVETLRRWFRDATATRAPDDRFGLIVFDGRAAAVSVPVRGDYDDEFVDVRMVEGTNIAEAISLGLAMFPPDTSRRLVLASDGNQTAGDALAAARQAAGGADGDPTRRIPIDIVPIMYTIRRDVQIVRVEVPPSGRPGQAVTARIIVNATEPIRGSLVLRQEGDLVDINGSAPGLERTVDLPAGRSVHTAQVVLADTPVNRFEALYEPAVAIDDVLPENNRAEAFTVTPGKGKTLVVDAETDDNRLATILAAAGIPVETRRPDLVPDDLLALQRYDLIVLDNVAAHQLSPPQQELLGRYVHDLGGGLIMIGGPQSFGAGGWNGTPVEAVLPLELDPSKTARLPTAALVLVLDKSGSMNRRVSGARATQQQVANEAAALAIESLRHDTLVGVVTFDIRPHEHVPLNRLDDPKQVADRVRAISAEGGTNLRPALARARAMLADLDVDRKRVVCLSDGESPTGGLDALVEAMARDNIKLTTIAVGDEADHATLKRLATIGGGEFYPVRNPRTLPRVLVDSVQVINEPLIKEVAFVPELRPTGSTLTAGMESAPELDGLVITVPREDPTVVVELVHPEGEPLLAHWRAGLGRTAAFTSDFRGVWSEQWLSWPGAATFWTQLARTIARPASDLQTELVAQVDGDRLHLSLEATDGAGGYLDYLVVDGTVYGPDGVGRPVRLKQVAPGRYGETVPALEAGNYIAALSPRQGQRRLAPAIGGASKTSSPEYRKTTSDLGVLRRIVDGTGGRTLDVATPRTANLFDRTGMPTSISRLPIWPLVCTIVLGLFLLDVACRRIAWDVVQVRAVLARAAARVTPGARGQKAQATLASLREVSARTETQINKQRPTEPPPRRVAKKPERPATTETAPASAKPSRASIKAALRSLRNERPPPPPEAESPADATEEEPEREDHTSSLLAAKRRARRDLDS